MSTSGRSTGRSCTASWSCSSSPPALCLEGLAFLSRRDKDAELLLAAAGLVALVAHPLRSLLQRQVDSIMFGDREDPYKLIVRLGRRLDSPGLPEEVLPIVVSTVADALRLPYVAIELDSQTGPVVAARTGVEAGDTLRLPLTHQAQSVGWLTFSARPRGRRRLSAADRRLLEEPRPSDRCRGAGDAADARAAAIPHPARPGGGRGAGSVAA